MLSFFLPLFLILLFLGLPVFFGLIAAPAILLFLNGQERDIALLYRNIYSGMDSFPLMAIPFFMLAGEVMNRANITLRLVEFSEALVGHLRGGLAHVNILSSMLFAGLSGSAVADVSALGSMLFHGGDHCGQFDYWPHHSPFGNHDYLCLCDGRKCGCAIFSRDRARYFDGPCLDGGGAFDGRSLSASRPQTARKLGATRHCQP